MFGHDKQIETPQDMITSLDKWWEGIHHKFQKASSQDSRQAIAAKMENLPSTNEVHVCEQFWLQP